MNLVDAVVVEIIEGPTLVTEGWAKGQYTVKYLENCYGNKKEQIRYFYTEQAALKFKVGTKYLT